MSRTCVQLSVLYELIRIGDWPKALALGSKFKRLGPYRDRISRAHDAMLNPDFYRQIKKDPDALIQDGINALKEL